MSKVIIYTPAYNAEKTLNRSVDSVLKQTHTDFVYYLLDNAATDSTGEIIEDYARKDKRIVPLHNKINWDGNWILDIIGEYSNNCYLCELDADDEYKQEFLEKMLAFMQEHNLEIAASGSEIIDERTGKLVGLRNLGYNLILEGEGFDIHFPEYHQFMRTFWGKVFLLSVLRKSAYKTYNIRGYGSDTYFVMKAFYNAARVGILNESLHKYYVLPKSESSRFNQKRIVSDNTLFNATYDYLVSKCGAVSQENLIFIYRVHLNAIKDTVRVLLNSSMSAAEKINNLRDIFLSPQTQELARWPGLINEKNELFRQALEWMLSQEKIRSDTGMDIAADILAVMDLYPSQIENWTDPQIFKLLIKTRNQRTKMGLPWHADAQIVSIAPKVPLLVGMDAGFLTFFHDIVLSILHKKESRALGQIKEIILQETDIPDEYIESFLNLGLNLSAGLKQADDFIWLKKLQVSLLIDLSRFEEAKKELTEWESLLPDDVDFKSLQERLLQ